MAGVSCPEVYGGKLKLLKDHGVALWDVIGSCARKGASDSRITRVIPNDIFRVLHACPRLNAIFLNGRAAEKYFLLYFSGQIHLPVFYLPSTSPANASIAYAEKLKRWCVIKTHWTA